MPNSLHNRSSLLMPFVVCGLSALFYVYDYFIQVAPSIMTEQLMRSFSINAAGLGILGAAFYYSYTLMQIPAGLLLDRLGARKLLSFAVFISASGVMLFGLTHNFQVAGVSRFLIGLGSSFAFISTLYLVARWFPHRYFAIIAGIVQLAGSFGAIFGEAPLATVVNTYGWRQSMIVMGALTFGLAVLFWLVIRDGKHLDSYQPMQIHHERQRLKYILRQPQVWWIALCGLVSWVPVATIGALWGVPYLMRLYHWNNVIAGERMTWFWVGLGLGSIFIGWYSERIGSRVKPLLLCFGVGLIATLLFMEARYFPAWSISFVLFALGASAAVQSLSFGVLKDIVPSEIFGTASGFNNMAAILGGAISQTLAGFILAWHWHGIRINNVPVYTLNDYRTAFILLPIAALTGLIIVHFKLRETHCRPVNLA